MFHSKRILIFTSVAVLLISGCTSIPSALDSNDSWLVKVSGTYLGEVASGGSNLPVTTILSVNTNRQVSGNYALNEQGKNVYGVLSSCHSNVGKQVTCKWKDKYGSGRLKMEFNEAFSAFSGRWNESGQENAYLWTGIKSKNNSDIDLPPNLIPMYGYPSITKSMEQKKADDAFIASTTKNSGSREVASKQFSSEAWRLLRIPDSANAMRRFNQSWLLSPDNYQAYWGFAVISAAMEKYAEASQLYEKAISLIESNTDKPRLFTDAAKNYAIQGAQRIDDSSTLVLFKKANILFSEAITIDPKYGKAYQAWAGASYMEGNYIRAWNMVDKARKLGEDSFPPGFIEMLSSKMPEPE